WKFGLESLSPDRLQYMLDFYDEGWRRGPYRLKVNYVADTLRFAELIVEKGLAYTVLELEHDVVWSRAVKYDLETALARIKSLPCSFWIGGFGLREILPVLNRIASFDYSYDDPPRYDWHPEKYAPEQLGPQWD